MHCRVSIARFRPSNRRTRSAPVEGKGDTSAQTSHCVSWSDLKVFILVRTESETESKTINRNELTSVVTLSLTFKDKVKE